MRPEPVKFQEPEYPAGSSESHVWHHGDVEHWVEPEAWDAAIYGRSRLEVDDFVYLGGRAARVADPNDPLPEVTADDKFIADDGSLHDTIEEWFEQQERLGVWNSE